MLRGLARSKYKQLMCAVEPHKLVANRWRAETAAYSIILNAGFAPQQGC